MRLITFVTPKALHHITDLWYSHRIVVDWSICVCVCVSGHQCELRNSRSVHEEQLVTSHPHSCYQYQESSQLRIPLLTPLLWNSVFSQSVRLCFPL